MPIGKIIHGIRDILDRDVSLVVCREKQRLYIREKRLVIWVCKLIVRRKISCLSFPVSFTDGIGHSSILNGNMHERLLPVVVFFSRENVSSKNADSLRLWHAVHSDQAKPIVERPSA